MQNSVTKYEDNKLEEEKQIYSNPTQTESQNEEYDYVESERSEEIWREIMKLYHMGEGTQGILNGCSNIRVCKKKLTELKGLL